MKKFKIDKQLKKEKQATHVKYKRLVFARQNLKGVDRPKPVIRLNDFKERNLSKPHSVRGGSSAFLV